MVNGVLWDSDKARPGGLSSLNVLLIWLQTGNNASRWQNGRRPVLCDEIVGKLKEQGTTNRSAGAVHKKLAILEKQFVAAQDWLAARRLTLSVADGKAKLKVLRVCRHYLALVPAFEGTASRSRARQRHPTTSGSSEDSNSSDYDDDEKDGDVEDDENGAEAVTPTKSACSIRGRSRTAPGESLPSVKPALPPARKRVFAAQQRSSERLSSLGERGCVPGSLGALEEGAKGVVQAVAADLKAEELAQRRQLFWYDLQAKRARAVCETVLSRKKLLAAGVPQDEVERVLPLGGTADVGVVSHFRFEVQLPWCRSMLRFPNSAPTYG